MSRGQFRKAVSERTVTLHGNTEQWLKQRLHFYKALNLEVTEDFPTQTWNIILSTHLQCFQTIILWYFHT